MLLIQQLQQSGKFINLNHFTAMQLLKPGKHCLQQLIFEADKSLMYWLICYFLHWHITWTNVLLRIPSGQQIMIIFITKWPIIFSLLIICLVNETSENNEKCPLELCLAQGNIIQCQKSIYKHKNQHNLRYLSLICIAYCFVMLSLNPVPVY